MASTMVRHYLPLLASILISDYLQETSNLNHPVIDINTCGLNTGVSPGFQGWYIQPLSIWANITSDTDLTKRYDPPISLVRMSR